MKKLFTAIFTATLLFGITAVQAQGTSANMIKFATYGGPDANALYIPASAGPTDRVLIIFHDWNGLDDNAKTEAINWEANLEGHVAVYAIDLYDGKTASNAFEAGKLMTNLDEKRAEAIVNGLLQKIGAGKRISTLGWGLGGTWAFITSAITGTNAAGCVMYAAYPVKDESRFSQFKTDALYMLSVNDEYVTRATMEQFQQKVTAAGRGFMFETFTGRHGFANIGSPAYQQVEANETKNMAIRFLRHKMSL